MCRVSIITIIFDDFSSALLVVYYNWNFKHLLPKAIVKPIAYFTVPLGFDSKMSCTGSNEKRSITAEKAVEIFKKHGTNITSEEAKLMLDFLYKFAKLTLETVLKR